jgi:hypothetical protein
VVGAIEVSFGVLNCAPSWGLDLLERLCSSTRRQGHSGTRRSGIDGF